MPLTTLDYAAITAAQRLRLVSANPQMDRAATIIIAKQLERAVELDRQRRAAEMMLGDCGDEQGFEPFHNRLRIMLSIDRHELVKAEVIKADDIEGWDDFRRAPFQYALRLDDRRAAALFTLIRSRETR